LLIRAGASGAPGGPTAAASLHLAARGGLDEVVAELLSRGVSPAAADHWGTSLHRADKQGHVSTMRLLLQAGADPNAQAPDHDFAPLHAAVIDRHLDAVQLLISVKAALDVRDVDGRTPLHWGGFAYAPQAVHLYEELGKPHDTIYVDPGPARAMELLLDAGANIEAVDREGNTPLHEAAAVGSRRAVELLLARGARRQVKNRAGKTPLSLARARNDADVVQLLGGRP
jgi:ankyrin repeat protein